ncbi:RNase P subunit p30-domain-containing protein [Fimicolochytrium jonesii]|uniref:RNase P subunit p30-domain-containing protein n=1 Tax=Fimicolochytrium jonesii TaxID=1396493 RepID=UPI0022FE3C70|nr:RNase P subunit p30-domain-containing protein [Fimicolochytrium jonesii]KAI8827043.1 RNase P subunit p30-domain-containing protein [Fimicolochytrium jonesii]
MFWDLNVPYEPQAVVNTELKKTIAILHEFGYGAVAYNVTYSGKEATSKRTEGFQQLSRLTVIADDTSANYQLTSANSNPVSYDLIAVQPTNEKLFQSACSLFDVDIVSLDMSNRLPFFIKGPTVNGALQHGVFFEIAYGAAIRDATARRHLISHAAALVQATKGKNILITSEAQKAMEIRGPYDVINLATIFGMTREQAKNALDANCRAVVLHAATRRQTHRGVLSMESAASLSAASAWKLGQGEETEAMQE